MGEQWFPCQDGASKFVVKFRFDVWVRGGLGPLGRVGRMDSTARYLSGAPRLSSPESVVPGGANEADQLVSHLDTYTLN